jgi:hypothetical protein
VRDAQGNILALYQVKDDSLYTKEFYMYGSQRLGYLEDDVFLGRKCIGKFCNIVAPTLPLLPSIASNSVSVMFGKKRYELSDWLGNVRVVINDRKTPVNIGTTTVGYKAQVVSVSDYYSFGGEIAERTYDPVKPNYRFGFNKHERLDEVYGKGNVWNFGDYGYDARLGRRWNVEPNIRKYPWMSSYAVFGNNPLKYADWDGREIVDPEGRRAVDIANGKVTFTEYATDDIKRVVNAMQITQIGQEVLMDMITSKNKIQIEIDKEHEEVYLSKTLRDIVFNKEEALNPNQFVLGLTRPIDKNENYEKVEKEGELPDVKITLFEKVINKIGDLGDIDIDLGATATHEGTHATDKTSNRTWLRFHDNGNKFDPENKPKENEQKFYDEIKKNKRDASNKEKKK